MRWIAGAYGQIAVPLFPCQARAQAFFCRCLYSTWSSTLDMNLELPPQRPFRLQNLIIQIQIVLIKFAH
jgi:hypothetical protein